MTLLDWYARNRRDLPWRRDCDPYRVLVSEIMLQQTQADRVVEYFERFVTCFPTLAALAAAPRAAVIQMWGGLGYNRRAVYLHQLAQVVQARYGGELPRDAKRLRGLPGIGPYTCGAILSIAFEQDEPALDTNARRVLARYAFRDTPKPAAIEEKAREVLPPGRARDWNQAIMDLGATVCVPRQPRCLDCPLRLGCQNRDRSLPIPQRASPRYPGSTRYYRGQLLQAVRRIVSWGDIMPIRDLPSPTSPRGGTHASTLGRWGLIGRGAISLAQAADDLQARGVAEPQNGWKVVSESLARDGLLVIEESPKGTRISLP